MPNRYPTEQNPSPSILSTSPTRYEPSNSIRSSNSPLPPHQPTSTNHDNLRQPSSRGGSGSSTGTRSSVPMASGSSRGLSPSREPASRPSRSPSGDSYKGTDSLPTTTTTTTNRTRREGSDSGLAGRGAGGGNGTSAGGGGGRGHHLPPINTHLQPGGRMSPSISSPTSANYDPSTSSSSVAAHSHRSSLLAQPRSNNALVGSSSSQSSYRGLPSPTFPPNSSTASPQPRSAGGTSNSHSFYPHQSSSSSRPGSSASQNNELSDRERGRRRGDSGASGDSASNSGAGGGGTVEKKRNGSTTTCAKCELPMTGQFVRALGTVYHLDCFRCQDCNKVVAAKFFPIDSPDGSGRQVPLCETDYFRRLNLLCSKCGAALRGSYITALDMKFHVEHFTCSVCPTVFGPQDSYYEHAGSVYCHFHYSTRFAVKCTGCRTAILKQFVEINRNSIDEHWHPECYMIHKFWNIKLAPTPKPNQEALPPPPASTDAPSTESADPPTSPTTALAPSAPQPDYVQQEESETPASLKSRQKHMEEQVYRIWTILSAFEESSAACISEMLRHVSSGHYMEGVRMAEKFVLHVETLFAAIDDLNFAFRSAGSKEMSHVREARMLCKKVVNFFMLLSHTHETGARKMSITQELLSLVTGLAHYLKILIRIALTGSLKLEREFSNTTAIGVFLGRLDRLARDPDANRMTSPTTTGIGNEPASRSSSREGGGSGSAIRKNSTGTSNGGGGGAVVATTNGSTKSRPYGYRSLTRAVGTLVGQGEATTDLCEGCRLTVEEECARLGTSIRWHLPCLKCNHCGRIASKDQISHDSPSVKDEVWVRDFVWAETNPDDLNGGGATFCKECARRDRGGSLEDTTDGFEYVTRLEQYAFLLCVALNKLYGRLKQRGVVPAYDEQVEGGERSLYDTYRDSNDIKRMKSVQLDRKLSSTTARIPKRSTVIQSPSGRTAQSDDSTFQLFQTKPPVPSRKDQPIVDPIRGTVTPRQNLTPTPSGVSTPALSTPRIQHIEPTPMEQRPRPTIVPPASSTSTSYHAHSPSPSFSIHQPTPTSAQPTQPQRPGFHRATTAVHIVDETSESTPQQEGPGLGGASEPTQDEEGITLADLPKVMEAEQKRAEQRHYFPNKLLSELSALEYFIVKHVAAVLLASETSALRDVAPLDELLEIIDARKNTFWGKLFKGGNEQKKVKKKGVFAIPLDVLVERNGADSMHGAGPGSLRIPSFVDDVISAMKQMDMSIEGIFRKNGNIRRLKDLTEALDRDSGTVNLSDDNPVQLAALLKKFLRDLPDPLMTFKLFHLFIAAQRIEDTTQRKKILHLCCCLMPKPHRDTMEVLFVFLKWVASFSHVDEETGSKMDLQNLATVISPNILYAKGKDPARDESFSAARAVHELLELQDDFWEVPTECLSILNDQELFANPSQLTSKEILARTENHLNGRGAGGRAVSISRGEASPAQRPGLQEAWSAPTVPGMRPVSTSAAPHRNFQERPISFSAQNYPYSSNGAALPSPTTRNFPNSPFGSNVSAFDRRGASEGTASGLPARGEPNRGEYPPAPPSKQQGNYSMQQQYAQPQPPQPQPPRQRQA
ncbi:uncharacterized protein JCM6883_001848 [Sporobolomyces salmoneus]|uniref:uncharacterized protein n=1 Tax=Sporobolomyces salmoneus TaxID=183962 RepID=UPI00317256C1